ncbi:TetR/AcrR family transcriptional regulator [Actinomadura sp. NEAU-AAG7]|uniref:TetR/AcrR family transcriptional regulator n=1 Tax=Actinomadura sp. NEAU-AAG7 TaxID=2839640 RepID=UPI001BE3D132|nr:TetR/AcrR family transcriptional regulator [Actinomadura sp. NEAU-AAG7]MBT2210344.1 TetR/AcrR family transcriptional regulator [Actinomadura sp. NEAU-AAG7]
MGPRMSAEERREMAIEAALVEFGQTGYNGTSTSVIAERVGVSQPYLFRLFPTKRALFLAAAERCFDDIEAMMRDAAGGLYGVEALRAMSTAYRWTLSERPVLLRFQLKLYAAAVHDEEVSRLGHVRWARLWRLITELSGGEPEEVLRFVAVGLLANVLTLFDVPYTSGEAFAGSVRDWSEQLRGVEHLADWPIGQAEPRRPGEP